MYQQVKNMVSGKSETELREMAINIAKERGIDLNGFAQSLGVKL